MTNAGIFIGWNGVIPGRETMAHELFQSATAFWTKRQRDGDIESFEPVLLTRHGEALNGFFLIRGDRTKLETLKRTNDYLNMIVQADHFLAGLQIVDTYMGNTLDDMMKRWRDIITR
jgi:hypothetical protein